ncbi:MAG TPA: hypothetical protein VEA15_00240 [Caulobacteraceae bacterium]|nr:hypothetical protein [Caulobacteraceae bacterium]
MRPTDRLRLARAVVEASLFGPATGAAVFVALTFLKSAFFHGWGGGAEAVRAAWPILRDSWVVIPAALLATATLGLLLHGMLYALHLRRALPYAFVGLLFAIVAGWSALTDLFLAGTIGEMLGDARTEAILAAGLSTGVVFWRRRRPDMDPP